MASARPVVGDLIFKKETDEESTSETLKNDDSEVDKDTKTKYPALNFDASLNSNAKAIFADEDVEMSDVSAELAVLSLLDSQSLIPRKSSLTKILACKLSAEEAEAECEKELRYNSKTKEHISTLLHKIALREQKLQKLKSKKQKAQDNFVSVLASNGTSAELLAEYEGFCNSLHQRVGQMSGFAADTFEDHGGNYIQVEASGSDYVEFSPIMFLKPREEGVMTLGEQYPTLYELAIQAVKEQDSEVAMEMLIKLPYQNAALKGDLLFDYQPDGNNSIHPIISKRWEFNGAYSIKFPLSSEVKRLRLNALRKRGPTHILNSHYI